MNIINTNLNLGQMDYGNNPQEIIIHHSEASHCSIEDINVWHKQNGWAGVGYHYFVRKDGSIYKGRPDNAIGAHCQGSNTNTLGVCFEGSYNTEIMPEIQLNAGRELIDYLKKKYGIGRISKHRDHMSTDCPGNNFPWNELINGGNYVGNVAPTKDTNYISIAANYLSTSFKVKLVQLLLNCFGWSLNPDGICGNKTATAIGEFQDKYGLYKDYKFGPQCFNKAYDLIKDRICGLDYKTPNETRVIQHLLGLNVDSVFWTLTNNAVRTYQGMNGLKVDGVVGPNTWAKLLGI